MKSTAKRLRLSQQLKEAIESHGLPVYLIAERAGVAQPVLSRFLSDDPKSHRDIQLERTVEKLAAYFGMELTKPTRPPVSLQSHPSSSAENIGRRIQNARKKVGLEQSAAAELAGLSQSSWSRAESGARAPSIKTLQKIAAALKISVRDLMPK